MKKIYKLENLDCAVCAEKMKNAIDETNRRREIQMAYNREHNVKPMTIKKEVVNKKVTFSGGEPLMQVEALIDIVKKLSGFDVAVYTGHEFEEIPQELLDNITYIKTGSFKEEFKSTVKPYVGSTNQEFRRVK